MPTELVRREDATVTLLLVLSATTGMVDAASVLGLGKVFTANMTGNVVFLGFALAGAPGFTWPPCLVALIFFAAGAAAGGRLGRVHAPRGRRRWLLLAGGIEAVLLWLAAACALTQSPAPVEAAILAMIALTATAMGVRNATVRNLKVADLTTTVLTLTITGLAADTPVASGSSNPNLGRRIGAVLAILVGALVGAMLVLRAGLPAPLILAGLIIVVATVALVADLPEAARA